MLTLDIYWFQHNGQLETNGKKTTWTLHIMKQEEWQRHMSPDFKPNGKTCLLNFFFTFPFQNFLVKLIKDILCGKTCFSQCQLPHRGQHAILLLYFLSHNSDKTTKKYFATVAWHPLQNPASPSSVPTAWKSDGRGLWTSFSMWWDVSEILSKINMPPIHGLTPMRHTEPMCQASSKLFPHFSFLYGWLLAIILGIQ